MYLFLPSTLNKLKSPFKLNRNTRLRLHLLGKFQCQSFSHFPLTFLYIFSKLSPPFQKIEGGGGWALDPPLHTQNWSISNIS